MLTRTWPYGTRRKAKTESIEVVGMGAFLAVVTDELGEGHILIADTVTGAPGDEGELVFTEGGPTGGYWRFERSDHASA